MGVLGKVRGVPRQRVRPAAGHEMPVSDKRLREKWQLW